MAVGRGETRSGRACGVERLVVDEGGREGGSTECSESVEEGGEARGGLKERRSERGERSQLKREGV